jgi:hypothetical protein
MTGIESRPITAAIAFSDLLITKPFYGGQHCLCDAPEMDAELAAILIIPAKNLIERVKAKLVRQIIRAVLCPNRKMS